MKITIVVFTTGVNVLVKANCCHKHSKISVALHNKSLSNTDSPSSMGSGAGVELCSTESFRDSSTCHVVAGPSPGALESCPGASACSLQTTADQAEGMCRDFRDWNRSKIGRASCRERV